MAEKCEPSGSSVDPEHQSGGAVPKPPLMSPRRSLQDPKPKRTWVDFIHLCAPTTKQLNKYLSDLCPAGRPIFLVLTELIYTPAAEPQTAPLHILIYVCYYRYLKKFTYFLTVFWWERAQQFFLIFLHKPHPKSAFNFSAFWSFWWALFILTHFKGPQSLCGCCILSESARWWRYITDRDFLALFHQDR